MILISSVRKKKLDQWMLSCMLCVNKKLLKCKTRTTIVCAENMRKTN